MLCVKVGMESERKLVAKYIADDVLLISGVGTSAEQLETMVPHDCAAIISVGTCGALAPTVPVGSIFVCSSLLTPHGWFSADHAWLERITSKMRCQQGTWWSTKERNTADSVADRADLYRRTGCSVIDDETSAVALLAERRDIPFQALRSVSDQASTTLPPAVTDALNEDGSTNIAAVIASICSNPWQIPALVDTAVQFKKSLDALRVALATLGPQIQWTS